MNRDIEQTTLANRLVYDIQVQNIYSAEMYNEIYNTYNKSDGHNIIKHSLCKIMNPEYQHYKTINIDEYWDSTMPSAQTYVNRINVDVTEDGYRSQNDT